LGGQLLGVDDESAQALGERVKARVDAAERVKARCRSGEQLDRARCLGRGGGKCVRPGARRGAERLQSAHPLASAEQVGMLALIGSGAVDLRQLVLEQVEFALACRGELAERFELRLQAL